MEQAPQEQSFFETIKENLNPESIKNYFTQENVVMMLICFAIGMFTGFIVKRFGRYFLFACVISFMIFYAFHKFEIATFDVDKLKELLGLARSFTFGEVLQHYVEWIKSHIVFSLCAVIGFIIGQKI